MKLREKDAEGLGEMQTQLEGQIQRNIQREI